LNTILSSSITGFHVRLRRIINQKTGRTLIIPIDHGITIGPVNGLIDIRNTISSAAKAGADAIMLRPGLMKAVIETESKDLGIILCLTGRFDRGIDHVQLNSVEYAVKSGADAICAEFKLGSDGDLENAKIASEIAERAHEYGLPVLMTIYALPEYVKKMGPDAYSHACRIGEELGADIIKTSLPSEPSIIEKCLNAVRIPIVVAGGGVVNQQQLFKNIKSAIDLGVSGAAIGRNVWANTNALEITQRLRTIIHE
jgi:DhnA family fructose-bisphosphate aldolase class Ia